MQTKEDLRTIFTEKINSLGELSLGQDIDNYRLAHTSGTTGLPLPLVYDSEPDWNPAFLGIGQRSLMLFGSKSLRLDFALANKNSDVLFLNANASKAEIYLTYSNFKPDNLVSPPSLLLRLTQDWPKTNCLEVKSVVLAGELVTASILSELKQRFSNATFTNTYSSMETGLMGVSCPKCRFNEFHPGPGVNFRILAADGSGQGDLLVTKQNPGGAKLKDYRVGDVAELSNHDGQTTILLLGRRGFDYVKLAGVLLLREELDRVAAELKDFIKDYKAVVSSKIIDGSPQHKLCLHIAAHGNWPPTQLKQQIATEFAARLFVTPRSTLKEAIEKNVFAPLEIKLVNTVKHQTAKPQRLYQI